MHNIQKTILDRLMSATIKRFSELKPSHVESNLFQYHLRHIIKEGYVEKVEGGYTLSPKGLYYADRHSASLRTVREQPKVITIVALRNSLGQVLLTQKLNQPFIGRYNLPAGKLHTGESIDQAAVRELQEKTAFVDIPLNHISTIHARISMNSELVSEYVAFVYHGVTGQSVDGAIWHDVDQSGDYELAPSVSEILQTLNHIGPLLQEIEINL